MDKKWVKWLIVIGCGLAIAVIPPPEGVTREAWTLLAVFIATIVGSIVQPLTDSAIVLFGVVASVLFGALKPTEALSGYSDPVVWLCLAALFLSAAVIKTGLGRRTALIFVKTFGRTTIGLGYALVSTDFMLASIIPSNAARNGGVILPIVEGISSELGSRSDDGTAGRLGTFLINLLYQCDVIICATFLTGQAGNLVIAKLASENAGTELSYVKWFAAGIVPAVVSLVAIPLMIYKFFPPEIKTTPEAAAFADAELKRIGKITGPEKLTVLTMAGTLFLWATKGTFHDLDTAIVALIGIGFLLITRALTWKDLMGASNAWSIFIWYGGVVGLATALGETGITKVFAGFVSGNAAGFAWTTALMLVVLVYFYAHYLFASITAHALAMYAPFVAIAIAIGAPPGIVLLSLAFASNLSAGLTQYGTTPGPIYFAAGYVKQGNWWTIGLIASILNILIWATIGPVWWRFLGWW